MTTTALQAHRLTAYVQHHAGLTIYGRALAQTDALAYLIAQGRSAKVVAAGIALITADNTPLTLIEPIFVNNVGWAYLVDELDSAVEGE